MNTFVNYTQSDYSYVPNHIADAFSKRSWLVSLGYAQHNFVVAIDCIEAATGEEAVTIALKRAQRANRHLGNLITVEALRDTNENRDRLGVSGRGFDEEESGKRTVAGRWRNAA